MNDRAANTVEEGREKLSEACAAIAFAAEILREHLALFEQFERESELMDIVGPIIEPTLFKSERRKAAQALLKPMFDAAKLLVKTVDAQKIRAQSALEIDRLARAVMAKAHNA